MNNLLNINYLSNRLTNVNSLQLFQLMRFGGMFLISIILSKSNITTHEIGQYETFIFINSAITAFWVNGLIQAFLPTHKQFCTGNTKNQTFFSIFLCFCFISAICSILFFIFLFITGDKETYLSAYNQLLILYLIINTPSFLIEYYYLLLNKPKSIFIYGTITTILQLLLIASLVVLSNNIKWGIIGLLLIAIFKFIWLIIIVSKNSVFQISRAFILQLFKTGYPLIFSSLLSSVAQYFAGFLILHTYNEQTFAIFRYGARELPFVLLLASAYSNAMIPEFAVSEDLVAIKIKKLKQGTKKLINLLFPATILLLFSSKFLFPIIFNPAFKDSANVFNIYLLLIISRLIFPHTIVFGQKRTKIALYASGIDLFTTVLLSICLVIPFNIEGVAMASVIAHCAEKLFYIIYLNKKMNINLSQYLPINQYITYSIITLGVFIIVTFCF